MDNGNSECTAEHHIQRNNESQYQESKMLDKISFIFQPLLPYYEAFTHSNRVARYFLSVLMSVIAFQGMILPNESKERVASKEDNGNFLHTITDSLYKIWFVIYTNLRRTVNYIESVYEEVVPLIPGKLPPFAEVDKENMTIRKLCFYSVLHMILRSTFHVKKYFQNILFETCEMRTEDI